MAERDKGMGGKDGERQANTDLPEPNFIRTPGMSCTFTGSTAPTANFRFVSSQPADTACLRGRVPSAMKRPFDSRPCSWLWWTLVVLGLRRTKFVGGRKTSVMVTTVDPVTAQDEIKWEKRFLRRGFPGWRIARGGVLVRVSLFFRRN